MGRAYTETLLWTVTLVGAGTLANDRTTGITGPNPVELNPYWEFGGVHVAVTLLNGNTFAAVKVYGSMTLAGFPAPGTPAEALYTIGNPGAVNQGNFRTLRSNQAGAFVPCLGVPRFLLLEYDRVVGGGGTSQLEIRAHLFGGDPMSGHE